MFGFENFEVKYKKNKIERKNRKKEKEKIDLKSINYFYIFFQIHLTCFPSLYKN